MLTGTALALPKHLEVNSLSLKGTVRAKSFVLENKVLDELSLKVTLCRNLTHPDYA